MIKRAADDGYPAVRLVQEAFNTTRSRFYSKLGFEVRELLARLNGRPPQFAVPRATRGPGSYAMD